jgi:hypothetical protein
MDERNCTNIERRLNPGGGQEMLKWDEEGSVM